MSNTEPKMTNVKGMQLRFEDETLEDVINTLKLAADKYGKNATIQVEYYSEDGGSYSFINYKRLKTEQESVRRVAEEAKSNRLRENYDQAEFLRLSQKYALKVT